MINLVYEAKPKPIEIKSLYCPECYPAEKRKMKREERAKSIKYVCPKCGYSYTERV